MTYFVLPYLLSSSPCAFYALSIGLYKGIGSLEPNPIGLLASWTKLDHVLRWILGFVVCIAVVSDCLLRDVPLNLPAVTGARVAAQQTIVFTSSYSIITR